MGLEGEGSGGEGEGSGVKGGGNRESGTPLSTPSKRLVSQCAVRNQRQLDFLSNCLLYAPAPVSEMIDSCVLHVGGSMPPILSCDRTAIPIFGTR